MEDLLLDILQHLRTEPNFGSKGLSRAIREHSARLEGDARFAKKQLLPAYLQIKQADPKRWQSWEVSTELERRFVKLVQMKPRRSASGVATITVITKPWPCSSDCHYCPNDVRMPKSYRFNEPACQRAERCCFDPFLQVSARLQALTQMGHPTDKVELIVLGGTWSDYPETYQRWFMHELFRALNLDEKTRQSEAGKRARQYEELGMATEPKALEQSLAPLQAQVDRGELSYNQAVATWYGRSSRWQALAAHQEAGWAELEAQQRANEDAQQRCVGLVVETRPDAIHPAALAALRQMGCTKIQMGVQSLSPDILAANKRSLDLATIQNAFSLLRLFGFKIHAHFMLNLLGATPEGDRRDYREFACGLPYQPDEVKLYPCALIQGTALCRDFETGAWKPYSEEELVSLLADAVLCSPPWLRISRMIRDFSSQDIVAGNKKTNLRQLVEERVLASGQPVREIRMREISTQASAVREPVLEQCCYQSSDTDEHFLQWVDEQGRIAGFLRLSLPYPQAIKTLGTHAPVEPGEAMIREVHVYGQAAKFNETAPAQHRGLGRQLVAEAERIAAEAGYQRINVISAIGTRNYYRRLGYTDHGLYLQKPLDAAPKPQSDACTT